MDSQENVSSQEELASLKAQADALLKRIAELEAQPNDASAATDAADSQPVTGQAWNAPTGERPVAYAQPKNEYSNAQPRSEYAYTQPIGQQAYTQHPNNQYSQPYRPVAGKTRDHVAAALLAIFLGPLGIHKFYLGYNVAGFIMLAVTLVGSLLSFGLVGIVMWVIGLVEGIIYLSKNQMEFEQTYVFGKKEWF